MGSTVPKNFQGVVLELINLRQKSVKINILRPINIKISQFPSLKTTSNPLIEIPNIEPDFSMELYKNLMFFVLTTVFGRLEKGFEPFN